MDNMATCACLSSLTRTLLFGTYRLEAVEHLLGVSDDFVEAARKLCLIIYQYLRVSKVCGCGWVRWRIGDCVCVCVCVCVSWLGGGGGGGGAAAAVIFPEH
jgi:hypothetical protein